MYGLLLGYIATGIMYLSPVGYPGVSGRTPAELDNEYEERVNYENRFARFRAPLGYDVIWTAALMLNDTIHDLAELGKTYFFKCLCNVSLWVKAYRNI